MKPKFNFKIDQPISNRDQGRNIRLSADYIVRFFENENIILQVVAINHEPQGLEYCCKIAVGTPISNFQKYQNTLGVILGSPNGKVDIQAPIPGRDLIGITVPWIFPFTDIPYKDMHNTISHRFANNWRTRISVKLFRLSEKLGSPVLSQSIG